MIGKIGFACKYITHTGQLDGIKPNDPERIYNTTSTTITWLNRQERSVAEDKLWQCMKHNIQSVYLLVQKVATLPQPLHMVRIGSDILPAFTEPSWRYFYQQPDVISYCEREFAKIGDFARLNNIRLSMHPGQYCVLASDNPNIVERSIEEFEYHATMARYMGYGKSFQDFKINVHIAGRAGPAGIRAAYTRLTPEARNTLTIENEEISWGLDDCLTLSDLVPIVLDIHHHYIHTGEYIESTDSRITKIIESWRGIRPVIHYSQSREDILVGHPGHIKPDLHALLADGYKKAKLRAHSDFYWNTGCNDWAITHLTWADMMAESKAKNLATQELYNIYWKQNAEKTTYKNLECLAA